MYETMPPFALGLLLGGMGVFSFMVAPTAFRALPELDAGRFVRALFPHYYLFVIALSLIAGILLVAGHPYMSKLMFLCAALGVVARQVLMPRINALRDRSLAGDASAGRWFGRLHGVSMVVNLFQIVAAVAAALTLHV
jgi:hypothetical protein